MRRENRKKRKKENSWEMKIVDLPGELFFHIISFISPRDACRSALVSPWFRLAVDSDVVWEKFLPSDYEDLISQSDTIPETIKSGPKKDLYFYLCNNRIRIGNSNMSFSIDRESGKKCFMVGARGLSIAWGGTPQYWKWISLPESRFPEVAELNYVCWLHIIGKVETRILSPQTLYEARLVFNFAGNGHNFQNWPVQLRVDFEGNEDGEGFNVFLDSQSNDREDGWKDANMGEFFNKDGEDGSVLCSLKEVDDFHAKFGLIVEGIELRPKHV